MAKIDLDALGIEELVNLRDRAIEKLAEKVAARQTELKAELDRLSQYGGKPAKKAETAPPAPRAKRSAKLGETAEANTAETKTAEAKTVEAKTEGEGGAVAEAA